MASCNTTVFKRKTVTKSSTNEKMHCLLDSCRKKNLSVGDRGGGGNLAPRPSFRCRWRGTSSSSRIAQESQHQNQSVGKQRWLPAAPAGHPSFGSRFILPATLVLISFLKCPLLLRVLEEFVLLEKACAFSGCSDSWICHCLPCWA